MDGPTDGHPWLTLALVSAIVAAFAAGHFTGGSSLRNVPSYDPEIGLGVYWSFLERTFAELFYAFRSPPWLIAAAGSSIAAGIVLWTRQTGPALGFVLFAVGVVPIAFIAPRALSAVYIPVAGLAMVLGGGAAAAAKIAAGRTGRWAAPGLCALIAGCVLSRHLWVREHGIADRMMAAQADEIRSIRTRLYELVPDPAPGSRILLLEDPFLQLEDSWFKGWASVFLVELMYEDVQVDQRFRMNPPPDAAAIEGYDYVLKARDARLELVQGPEPDDVQ